MASKKRKLIEGLMPKKKPTIPKKKVPKKVIPSLIKGVKKPFIKKPGAVLTPFAKGLAGAVAAGEGVVAHKIYQHRKKNKNKSNKKQGGKITSRMSGGQVVDAGYN